jgi:hypothetical protein
VCWRARLSGFARSFWECLRLAGERFKLAAAAITAFDPSLDADGRTLAAARHIAGTIARGAV